MTRGKEGGRDVGKGGGYMITGAGAGAVCSVQVQVQCACVAVVVCTWRAHSSGSRPPGMLPCKSSCCSCMPPPAGLPACGW